MYYLRCRTRKDGDPKALTYSKLSSGDMACGKTVKVSLKRLSVLENPENHDFYINNGKIEIERKIIPRFFEKKYLLFFIILLFLLLSIFYFKVFSDACHIHGTAVPKIEVLSNKILSVYNKWRKGFGLSRFLSLIKIKGKSVNAPTVVERKRDVCYNDIRDFVKDYIPSKKTRIKLVQSGQGAFIEEQCRMAAVKVKIADNFENLWTSEKIIDVDSLPDYASSTKGAKILKTDAEPYVEYKIHVGILQYFLGIEDISFDVLPLCRFSTSLCRHFSNGPSSMLQNVFRFLDGELSPLPDFDSGRLFSNLSTKHFKHDFVPRIRSTLFESGSLYNVGASCQPWKRPGDCWSFKGSRARVQIELSDRVHITRITLEHIPAGLDTSNSNVRSAPKRFSVIGVDDSDGYTTSYLLGHFEYQIMEPNVQTFSLSEEHSAYSYKIIEFVVESNHGNDDFTCVYRLRVHGYL